MENSIEEITFVENEIKNTRKLFEEVGCYTFFDEDLCKAIEHILSDYKRVLKENEELKDLMAHKNAYTKKIEKDLFENCSNYVISKQKAKDKIEEYKNMLKTCNKVKDVDRIKALNERILELQELLGSEE